MGISFSCPFATYNDLEDGLESIVVKSISLGDDEVKTTERSISFKGQDSEPKIIKSLGSGKMIVEGSISFNQREKETMVSINISSTENQEDTLNISVGSKSKEMDNQSASAGFGGISGKIFQSAIMDLGSHKHEAAIKLQKVYKSFRTRRKLADCAVLVEQSWWKLLDFAELKHSSISFFDIEHHETAISRWSRAKTRAAKVGKGLSKNDKAQKLALQHWLEAIDPRHRYGHNLHFYYVKWFQSQSRQPFFYWLDIGEGKEVNLVDKCPRSMLQQQGIKYLGPIERKAYEVAVENGKLFYKQSGELLNTTTEPHSKWIFVLGTSKALYVGKKKKGTFQHSSFLAGGATSAAGRLVVDNGILKA
ncbi:IQ domain-containing protein iqm2 [Ancistrocladus abbreviatus]